MGGDFSGKVQKASKGIYAFACKYYHNLNILKIKSITLDSLLPSSILDTVPKIPIKVTAILISNMKEGELLNIWGNTISTECN